MHLGASRQIHPGDKTRNQLTACRDVQMVTCADKLHNVRSMASQYTQRGESFWQHFARGRQEQAWYYRSMTLALGRQLQGLPLYNALCDAVEDLFAHP